MRRWGRRASRRAFLGLGMLGALVGLVLVLVLPSDRPARNEALRGADGQAATPAPSTSASASAPATPAPDTPAPPTPPGTPGAPTAAGASGAPPPRPSAPSIAAVVAAVPPAGWRTYRAPDGSYTMGVPPGWRTIGSGATLRFRSRSDLSQAIVRSERLPARVGLADGVRWERRLRVAAPGYRRLSMRVVPYQGTQAVRLEYLLGRGAGQQRNVDLLFGVRDRGYVLHVQSYERVWRYAAPLARGMQTTFRAGS